MVWKKQQENKEIKPDRSCTSQREQWRRKSWKPPHRQGQEGALVPQKRMQQQVLRRQMERIHHRDNCQPTLPRLEVVCMPSAVSRGWVLSLRLGRLDWGWLLWRYSDGDEYNTEERVQEKAWASQRSKRSLLQGHSSSMPMQTTGPCLHECHRWDKAAVVQDPRSGYAHGPATVKAGINVWGRGWHRAVVCNPRAWWPPQWPPSYAQVQVNTHNFLAEYLNWLFWGMQNMEPIPLEEPTSPLRLKYLLSDLYHHRYSSHTPTVSALLFCFPTPTELVSPNKPGLCPLSSWQETAWGEAYKQRQSWNQNGAPGAVWSKKREGVHSCSNRFRG